MKKKNFVVNIIAQLLVLLSNLIINFVLTPFVIEHLGEEAYGFIGLINNFVSYISVITVALNSLAGRFITISYHRKEEKTTNEYYTSVFYANVFLSFIVAVASFILSVNAANWINVPDELLLDVKFTILLSAINTIISLLTVVFGIAAFIRNKLYLNSISQMVGAIGRVIAIVLLFYLFEPHIWYFSMAAILYSTLVLYIQTIVTKKECPDLTINKSFFSIDRIIEIVKVGVWASIESFNKILQTGLDLLIANIFISPYATGILSIAKTVPNILIQLTTTIASAFFPELAMLYSAGKKEELKNQFKYTMKVLSLFMIVPLIGFMAYGEVFYTLWLKNRSIEDIKIIQILSVLTVFPLLVNAYVEGLYYANTLTNKIKGSVLYSFVFSTASIITEIILLKSTDLDPLYIIAGTSSLFMSLRYLIITPIYCAYVLELPKLTFYPGLLRSIVTSLGLYFVFYCINNLVIINSWFNFFAIIMISGVLGYVIVIIALLNKEERSKLFITVRNKLLSRRS